MEKPPANYDYFEMYLVAYCLKYPSETKNIKHEYIFHEGLYNILSIIKQFDSKNSISKNTINAFVDSNYSSFPGITGILINKVYSLIDELSDNKKDNDNQLYDYINFLQTRQLQNNAVSQLEAALDLVRKNYVKEGISKAKNIQFSKPETLLNTTTLMMQSLTETNGFKTGIEAIDEQMGGFLLGNMMCLVGDTGGMKTMVSIWLCLKILMANPDFTCLYFEKEMPVKDVARRLLAYSTGIGTDVLLKASIDLDIEQTDIIGQTLIEAFKNKPELESVLNRLKIVPQSNFHNVIDMHQYISYYKPNIWCLDFLTQITDSSSNKKDEGFALQVKNTVDKLKEIVIETGSFAIVLSQINKNTATQRQYKVPRLGDIEWSGTIQQYSAYIFANFFPKNYYKDDVDNSYFYLISLKGRNNDNITLPLIANPKICWFEDKLDSIVHSNMMNWLKGYKGGKI